MPSARTVASLVLVLLGAPLAAADEVFVDGIAAQVGTDIVLSSEVRRFAAPVEKRMAEVGAPPSEVAKLRAEILERMIERRLLEQAIRRTEISASDAEIDAAIDAIAEENGLTREQVEASVVQQGMTYEAYRDQIRSEIQRQKLLGSMVHPRVRVEESEIRDLYRKRYSDQPKGGEEVHIRHILVPFRADSDDAEAEACAEAEGARQRVLAGESFAEVAQQVSEVNPQYGGDVGWLHGDSLAGWMSGPVRELEPGQMSPVIRTRFGCNVLLLEERRGFERVEYEQARGALYQELWDLKMAEEYTAFLEKLRENTYIERKGIYAGTAPSLTEPVGGR